MFVFDLITQKDETDWTKIVIVLLEKKKYGDFVIKIYIFFLKKDFIEW